MGQAHTHSTKSPDRDRNTEKSTTSIYIALRMLYHDKDGKKKTGYSSNKTRKSEIKGDRADCSSHLESQKE
jgi:hypothetical protein